MHNATPALARVLSFDRRIRRTGSFLDKGIRGKACSIASGIPIAAKPHEYSQCSLVVLKGRHSGAQMY